LFWKNRLFFGFSFVAIIILQAGVSFLSVRFFLEGNLILGFVCFFTVPLMALLAGFYFIWFRQGSKGQPR